MKKSQSIFEVLAVLGSGALLAACGGTQAPANVTEVPSAAPTEAPAAPSAAPSAAPAASNMPAAPTPSAAPTTMPSTAPATNAAAMPSKKDMPKGNHTVKVKDSSRKKACESGCGAGTCGSC